MISSSPPTRTWKSEKVLQKASISTDSVSVKSARGRKSSSTCGKETNQGSSLRPSSMNSQADLTQSSGSTLLANKKMVRLLLLYEYIYLDESKIRISQLNLVDLAGSEGASRT